MLKVKWLIPVELMDVNNILRYTGPVIIPSKEKGSN
jgi:hypothetical protein